MLITKFRVWSTCQAEAVSSDVLDLASQFNPYSNLLSQKSMEPELKVIQSAIDMHCICIK